MWRRGPVVFLTVGFAVLVGWYAVSTERIIRELRREAQRSGQMSARVFQALSDPSEEASAAALLDLAQHIREMGVPIVITDPAGIPRDTANLPFRAPLNGSEIRDYIHTLDAQNAPVVEPGVGIVHFGNTPLVEGLRIIPVLQGTLLAVLIVTGLVMLRTRAAAEREKVWAGMAREAAHQLGTPLSSLRGWVEHLRSRAGPGPHDQMEGDLDRLERVAHRFERIGRPPRADRVDTAQLIDRVAAYYRARVPTLVHPVSVTTRFGPGGVGGGAAAGGGGGGEGGGGGGEGSDSDLIIRGDAVLLEWAVEAIVKNAVDALAGRGGTIALSVDPLPGGGVRLRVADNGPGVGREIRRHIFRAGFSTKARGWGIGLSLARRIVEEVHGGQIALMPPEAGSGAVFDIILSG